MGLRPHFSHATPRRALRSASRRSISSFLSSESSFSSTLSFAISAIAWPMASSLWTLFFIRSNVPIFEEAMGQAMAEMANDNVEEKLDSLDRNDEIERLLAD